MTAAEYTEYMVHATIITFTAVILAVLVGYFVSDREVE